LRDIKQELRDTKQELRDTKLRVTDLEESVGILCNRFLTTFKRDKLQNATPADIGLITGGNQWTHNGS
jgi:hypothetical protein